MAERSFVKEVHDLKLSDGQEFRRLEEWLNLESRAEKQALYAACATHHLAMIDGTLGTRFKRVDLVNCDALLASIQLFP